MKKNREKFKQFVIEQLKDYDEWREASTEGYAEIITDEAVKLFCQPAVIKSVCDHPWKELESVMGDGVLCRKCNTVIKQTVL